MNEQQNAWRTLGLEGPLLEYKQGFTPEPVQPGHFSAATQIALLRTQPLLNRASRCDLAFFRNLLNNMLAAAPLLLLRGEQPTLNQTPDVHHFPYGLTALLSAWSAGQIMTEPERQENFTRLSSFRGDRTRTHERIRTWQIGLALSAPSPQWNELKIEISSLSTRLTELCRLAWGTLQLAHQEGDPHAQEAAGRLSELLHQSSAQIGGWADLGSGSEEEQLQAALRIAELKEWEDVPGLHSSWHEPRRDTSGHVTPSQSVHLIFEVLRSGMDAAEVAAGLGLAPTPSLAGRAALGLLTDNHGGPHNPNPPVSRPELRPQPVWGTHEPKLAGPWTRVLARSTQLMTQAELARVAPLPPVLKVPKLSVSRTVNPERQTRVFRLSVTPHEGDLTPAILSMMKHLQTTDHHTRLEENGELIARAYAAQGHHTLAAAARALTTRTMQLDTLRQLSVLAGWISGQDPVNTDAPQLDDLMKSQTSVRQLNLLKVAQGSAPRTALLLAWALCRDEATVEELTNQPDQAARTIRLLAAREQVSAWSHAAAPNHKTSPNTKGGLMAIIRSATQLGYEQGTQDAGRGESA